MNVQCRLGQEVELAACMGGTFPVALSAKFIGPVS